MERQSGLGRSLEDVLDSLTPADADASAPGRVLFEPEDLEQQLDSLMGDIRELRDRVQHLVALAPDDEAPSPDLSGKPEKPPKKQAKKQAKKHGAKGQGKDAKKAKKHKKHTKRHREAA